MSSKAERARFQLKALLYVFMYSFISLLSASGIMFLLVITEPVSTAIGVGIGVAVVMACALGMSHGFHRVPPGEGGGRGRDTCLENRVDALEERVSSLDSVMKLQVEDIDEIAKSIRDLREGIEE